MTESFPSNITSGTPSGVLDVSIAPFPAGFDINATGLEPAWPSASPGFLHCGPLLVTDSKTGLAFDESAAPPRAAIVTGPGYADADFGSSTWFTRPAGVPGAGLYAQMTLTAGKYLPGCYAVFLRVGGETRQASGYVTLI